jgi:DNA mismatch endonuclease (patch repair protein)
VADNLTKEQRSFAMSRIRSRGNSSTEQALIKIMRSAGIRGWRRKSSLCGKPDFVFPRFHTVVFVDGCYWHGCRTCRLGSKSNNEYWEPKIEGNAKRDRRNTKQLRNAGWKVIRIWEHELKASPMRCMKKIMRTIGPEEDR